MVCFTLGIVLIILLFGRSLCAFVCPLGTMQDMLTDIRCALHIRGIPQSEKTYRCLRLLRTILFCIFILIGCFGVDYCHFCPAAALTSPAFAGFRYSIYVSGILAVAVLVMSFFKERFFCNICPLGFLVGLLSKWSTVQLKKDCGSCTECGACYEACPMGIKTVTRSVTSRICPVMRVCCAANASRNARRTVLCTSPSLAGRSTVPHTASFLVSQRERMRSAHDFIRTA